MSNIKGRDPISQLYRAVYRYVSCNGGSVAVIGGIQLIQWPTDASGNFTIAVKCTGKLPAFAQPGLENI